MKTAEPVRSVFRVTRKEYLTPHYIRVYLTGEAEAISLISETTIGVNNKILIPPLGVEEIHFPKMDPEKRVWIHPAEDLKPIVRTYTHRGIDLDTGEIWIDFVAHGDEGPASAWAIKAKAGDPLGVMMKAGKKELYPVADFYMLVGDATALPVIGAILEDLTANAKGIAIIEVNSQEDEQKLYTKADFEIIWVHNPHPQNGSELADYVKKQTLPQGSRFAYIAAEFTTVKELRTYLKKEQKWEREELYAYSYWKAGVAEDRSVQHRREESQKDR